MKKKNSEFFFLIIFTLKKFPETQHSTLAIPICKGILKIENWKIKKNFLPFQPKSAASISCKKNSQIDQHRPNGKKKFFFS